MIYLLSYDISENKKRTKLSKFLEKKGRRIQKSVFLIDLKRTQVRTFKKEVVNIMGKGGDILLISLCNGCANKAQRFGSVIEEYLIF